MPFEIVRNDITNMQVDAIVNAASRKARINPGVDMAIHKKAGPQLLKAREFIGDIEVGNAGGFVGYCYGDLTLTGCTNTGNITAASDCRAGGLAATVMNTLTVTGCTVSGKLSGETTGAYSGYSGRFKDGGNNTDSTTR